MKTTLCAIAILFSLPCIRVSADTDGWRGDGSGRYPKARPPLRWSSETNVIWKTPLPKWSNASPVLAGRRLFLCIEPTTLVCLSSKDGSILWERSLTYADIEPPGTQERPLPPTHGVNGYSTPTPVTDGRRVYVLTGTGVAACFDLKGNRRWARFVETSKLGWGLSTSPVLAGGHFIVHINKVTGLDAKTGETAWETASAGRYGSLFASRIGKTPVILTANGEILRATDGVGLGGKILSLAYNGPVVHDGVAYFIQHGGKAARLPPVFEEGGKAEILWTTKPHNDRYYGSPLCHGGLIYAITQKSLLSAIDASTGEIVYRRNLKLAGTVYPSVTLAGEHLFVSSDDGTTVVVKPGRAYEEISRNKLEAFRSSPLFVKNRLYIRGLEHMYCIGEKKD